MTVEPNLALEEAAMRMNISGRELLGIVTGYGYRGWRTPLRAKLAVMLKDEYEWSYPQIARHLGLRSHTSALGLYRMGKSSQRTTQDPERAITDEHQQVRASHEQRNGK